MDKATKFYWVKFPDQEFTAHPDGEPAKVTFQGFNAIRVERCGFNSYAYDEEVRRDQIELIAPIEVPCGRR